ncbi:MAG: lipocalin family protein [Tidjanibacter sp.]|nr:lipocalin family protein [Tidjanibacter sp.]
MKRNIFTMMVAALVSLFALTSCEKDPDPAELIVGKWTVTSVSFTVDGVTKEQDPAESGVGATYTFKADGTGETTEEIGDEKKSYTFTYSVFTSGDKQILGITLEGDTANFEIQTLDENTLVFFREAVESGHTITLTTKLKRS